MINAGRKAFPRSFADKTFRTSLQIKLLQPLTVLQHSEVQRCICDNTNVIAEGEAVRASTSGDEEDITTTPELLTLHALSCTKFSQLITQRHNEIRDLLATALKQLKNGALVLTEAHVAPDSSGCRVRSDVMWKYRNEVIHYDTKVTSPLNHKALRQGSGREAGVAASLAEAVKRKMYEGPLQLAKLQSSALKPIVLETTGRLGKEAATFIQWLGDQHTKVGRETSQGEYSGRKLVTAWARAIWKHNAHIVNALASLPGTMGTAIL